MRMTGVEGRSELGVAAVLLAGYPVMLAAALRPVLWLFCAAAAVTYAADWWLHQRESRVVRLLGRVRVGVTMRFLLRQLLLVLLLARTGLADSWVFYVGGTCLLVFHGLQAPHTALLTLIRSRRRLPVVSRNVDLTGLHIPSAPPRFLTHRSVEKMLHCDLPVVAGLLLTAATGRAVPGLTGAAATLLLGTAFAIALLPFALLKSRTPADTEAVLEFVDDWLRGYRPGVVLYFSGSRTSAYQVNMWLDAMAGLGLRPLVILRERYIVPQLAPTRVPVLCVPSATHLMNMDLSSVRVALYPANVGKNIHLLRVPSMQHVFIGHGDSDKIASVNPYSKAYDEVWTAGRAGRDRYALADVGVRDEDIVEVGRPQLQGISAGTPVPEGGIATVLYAPTWEGWTDDPGNTSLILAGENIVRALLAARPEVRVLYKPHPFTGTRSPEAAAAHQRIIELIERANAERSADPRWRESAAAGERQRQEAADRLKRITARLDELERAARDDADEADGSRDGVTDPARAEEAEGLRLEWDQAYWESLPPFEHQVISGSRPHLYGCFNRSHALVSDISSVVSDFVASGKPYAITDTAGLGGEEFRKQNSTARAALILSPDAAGLPELLEAVREGGADRFAQARRSLKEYLLGPDEPLSQERFAGAVRALAAKADDRLARLSAAGLAEAKISDSEIAETGAAEAGLAEAEITEAGLNPEEGTPGPYGSLPGQRSAPTPQHR